MRRINRESNHTPCGLLGEVALGSGNMAESHPVLHSNPTIVMQQPNSGATHLHPNAEKQDIRRSSRRGDKKRMDVLTIKGQALLCQPEWQPIWRLLDILVDWLRNALG
jgi:hypothetical protein